jgi:hypothetical protein
MTETLIISTRIPGELAVRMDAVGQSRSKFIRDAIEEKLERQALGGVKAKTALGRKALELRRKYHAAGGRLLSLEEINAEVGARRGREA